MEESPSASEPSEAAPLEPSSSVQQQAPLDGHPTEGLHAPVNSHTANDKMLSSTLQQVHLKILVDQLASAGSLLQVFGTLDDGDSGAPEKTGKRLLNG